MSDIQMEADALRKAFESYGVEVETALERGILKSCLVVEAQAVTLAPYDTGRLLQSITHRVIRKGAMVDGQVGTNVEYGPAQEFGVPGRNRAQPFLGPALRQKRGQILQIVTREIQGVKP